MHLPTIAVLAALALPFGSAQLSNIPLCAQNVTESAITAAGCTDADVHCFCTPAFMGSLQSHVARTCSVADQQLTLGFTQNMCKSIGITFDLPPDMSVSVATTTATVTSTAVTSTAESLGPDISAGTTTVVDTTAMDMAMGTGTGTGSWAWGSTPSAKPLYASNSTYNNSSGVSNGTFSNGTLSPSMPAPSFTGGAARYVVQWVGAIAMGLVGVGVVL